MVPVTSDPSSTSEAGATPQVRYFHYAPHHNGLPPMGTYLKELWQRRDFAYELSRANMRADNSATVFGTIWLVLNPILMAGVYFLLVNILTSRGRSNPEYFVHLTTSLFVFTLITTCANTGTTSVTTAGKLILNTAFPRLLIPLAAVITAVMRFLPTLVVTLILLIVTPSTHWSPTMLLAVVFVLLMVLLGTGIASFFATCQVYFRDTVNFLPYFIRIWLYLSPVLWVPNDIAGNALQPIAQIVNPAYSLLTGYTSLLLHGTIPGPTVWLTAAVWSIAVFLLGTLFFIWRERDFAVRIF